MIDPLRKESEQSSHGLRPPHELLLYQTLNKTPVLEKNHADEASLRQDLISAQVDIEGTSSLERNVDCKSRAFNNTLNELAFNQTLSKLDRNNMLRLTTGSNFFNPLSYTRYKHPTIIEKNGQIYQTPKSKLIPLVEITKKKPRIK